MRKFLITYLPASSLLAILAMVLFTFAGCGGNGGGGVSDSGTTAMLGGAFADVAGGNGMPKPVVDVQMNCNTMVGVFEVDAAAARAVLPAKYELALQPNGKALVYLQASNCFGSGNGRPVGAFDLADAWLIIQGPPDYRPIYGADLTLPTIYVYVLTAQTTSEWVKTECAKIHFPKTLIRSLDVGGTIMPLRKGSVVEMSNSGYSWSEFLPCMFLPGTQYGECWMFPGLQIPVGFEEDPFPLGVNIVGYVNRSPGTEAMKNMGCLMQVAGQGFVRVQIDPKSDLETLGIFQDGQVGYFWDSTATCHLVMSQN